MSAGHTAGDVHVEVLHDHDEAAHGTLKSYLIGFVLSAVLTAIPFWLVMRHVIVDSRINTLVIMAFGFVQIIVPMHSVLHMNTKSEGGWTFLALVFTVVMVVITLAGSIWVMYHMNGNMMPMAPANMSNMKM